MHYNHLSVLSIFLAIPLADLATPPPHWGKLRVKHMWETPLSNWEDLGPPSADTTVDLSIALKPHHENALIDALLNVSDPGSPRYTLTTLWGCTHRVCLCSVSDTVRTCPRNRSLTL